MKRRDFLKISTTTAVATALTPLSGCGGSGGGNASNNVGTQDSDNQNHDATSDTAGDNASHPNNPNQEDPAKTPTEPTVEIVVDDVESKRWPTATSSEPINGAKALTQQSALSLSNKPENGLLFQHGVASGDPLPNRVVLWTRLTIPNKDRWNNPYNRYDEHIFYHEQKLKDYKDVFKKDLTQSVFDQIHASADYVFEVIWEVATDANMANIVAHGYTKAKKSKDFTVKVDPILPKANTTYYYRFRALGWASPVGRTKTAPEYNAQVSRVKLALFTCSDYQSGYYNAYGNVAKTKDIDAVLHVGDYIYETGYPGKRTHGHNASILDKPSELREFRGRFSQYRLDPDLQECHRQHPFIVIWDDHEFVNNYHPHNSSWQQVKQNAPQAYEEWMPIRRIPNPDDASEFMLNRAFSFGNLVNLSMLDTRRYRSKTDGSQATSPNRSMLGDKQESWFLNDLKRHQQRQCRWKVVGQQVIFSPCKGGSKDTMNMGLGEDIWNGYVHSRDMILNTVKVNQVDNLVVLSGDWHTGMAFDLVQDPYATPSTYNSATGEGALGVEFVAPSVTSDVWADTGTDTRNNPHLRFHNGQKNGYVLLEFTPEYCQGDFRLLSSLNKNDSAETNTSLRTRSGDNHLLDYTQEIGVDTHATALVSASLKLAKYV